MYKIDKESYGYHVAFRGQVTLEEMHAWLAESRKLLTQNPGNFCIYMDMIECESLPEEAEVVMAQVHELYMTCGMLRAAVVTDKLEMNMQPKIKNACIESGVYQVCRYIDIKTTPDWKKKAGDWIHKGIEPYR